MILPVPYWVSFKDIVRYAGGTPVFVETDESQNFKLTAQMVERAITPRTKLIVLNSPNNPSGAVMSREDVTSIIRLAHERGIYVMSDECYVYLDYTGHRFSAGEVQDAKEHLVIVGSLSKTYAMTGWREGFALAPAPIVSAMQKLQSQSTSNPTSIVQKAAVAALSGSQDCVEEMRQDYIRLRDRIVGGLREIPGDHLHPAPGRVLRLSERVGIHRARWNQVWFRSCQPLAPRSARRRGAGRGLRNEESHPLVLRDLTKRDRSRPGAHEEVLRLCRVD